MEVSGENVFELEDASTTEEALTPVATLYLVNRQKLFDLPNPKVSVASTGVKSVHMEQMSLLDKMDARRLN